MDFISDFALAKSDPCGKKNSKLNLTEIYAARLATQNML